MRILLIRPRWSGLIVKGKVRTEVSTVPPLGLGIIAALSNGHHVRIVEEDIEEIPFGEPWDLVGLTVTTFVSQRAYEICARFREQGVPTVMGGVHPSLVPEEASHHADAVVVGEAEGVWPRVLEDAANGSLEDIYKATGPADLSRSPIPRRDLYRNRKRTHQYVQFTRGCPRRCNFCYLGSLPWGEYRQRPIENAAQEVAELPSNIFFLADDNLFADRDYCLELFRALEPLGKYWWAQAPLSVADDQKLLSAARRSGCFSLAVGLQNLRDDGESKQDPISTAARWQKSIRSIQQAGLMCEAYLIFGFDHDDHSSFDETASVLEGLDLDGIFVDMLTPLPGTPLYEEYEKSDRLLTTDRTKFTWDNCVIRHPNISPQQMASGISDVYTRFNRGQFWRNFIKVPVTRARAVFRSPALTAYLAREGMRRLEPQYPVINDGRNEHA